MGVKIRKLRGEWYLVIDHRGKRKTRVIATDRKIAEEVRRKVEAKLALGDVGILSENQPCETSGSESSKSKVPLFSDYAATWLSDAEAELKRSTMRSYEQLLRLHVIPQFGSKQLSEISRKDVKTFVRSLAGQTRTIDQATGPRFSRNTLRLILCALRTVLSAAVEDGLLESNPASKVGKFAKREPREQEAAAMTRAEADSFLFAVRGVCPDWYPFFLTALRAGLRRGELIALKFGDIHFGASELDSSRYILVQRNYSFGAFTTPKNKKSRRVDMSRQLRATLIELRDQRLLQAYLRGKPSISDELVFPSQTRTPIKPDNIAVRYMQPRWKKQVCIISVFMTCATPLAHF